MKELIKHILNEETMKNGVSKKQIDKGIDIVVKGLNKEFPFVVGWKLHDDYKAYSTSIYIDLVVDYEKTKEFYGLKPNMTYDLEYIKNIQVSYPLTPFDYEGKFDPYLESQKLVEYVFDMYEYIPDELKLNNFNNEYRTIGEYKGLKVDDYIFI